MPAGSPARTKARELIATQIELGGPAWRNTANLVRSGFENLWLAPALDALEAFIVLTGHVDDDEG